MSKPDLRAWAVEWHSKNVLDGDRRWIEGVLLFHTRAACREQIEKQYGYMRIRPDLRAEPHGWFMPRAVRVVVNREKK